MRQSTFNSTHIQEFLFGIDQRLLATQWHLDIIIDGEYEDVPHSVVREWFMEHFGFFGGDHYFRLMECDVVQHMAL
jgi:hypothetical protein